MNNPFVKKDVYLKTGEEFTRGITLKEGANATLKGFKTSWKKVNYIYIFAVIFLVYLFSAISSFNWNLVTNILYSSVTVGIVAIGMGLIIITGEIDLSVGSAFAFIGGISVLCYNQFLPGMGQLGALLLTLVVALLLGVSLGFINGFLIGKLKMPGFIVTLATMLIFRSLIQYILSVQPGKPSTFRISGYGDDLFFGLGNTKILEISIVGILFILIGIIIALVMRYTKFGRKVYAVGSNPKAANLVGINSGWTKVIVFSIAGLLIGFSSFLQLGIRGSIDPATTGNSYELYAIAAVVLGGISMKGGRGSIVGVIFGTCAFQTIDKIIAALQLNANLNDTIKGAILIVAVAFQVVKISKQDMDIFLRKLHLKYIPDYDLILESQYKQKVDKLNKKYESLISKINNTVNLTEEEKKSKISELLKQKEEALITLKESYDSKIANAKVLAEKHVKNVEEKNRLRKERDLENNEKLYQKYLAKKEKVNKA